MAQTQFAPNDPLAIQLWSKKLSYEALQATKLSSFVGKTADSMIVVKDELNKNAGSKITFGLRMQLRGKGVSGESQLEGNEERLVFRNDSLTIDQLRNAVLNVGAVSQQRVPFDLREEGKSGLVDWWADRIDAAMMNQLAGNTNISDVKYTGMQSAERPYNPMYCYTARSGGPSKVSPDSSFTNEGSLSTGTDEAAYGFNLGVLTDARVKAETATLPIRPITVGSQKVYVCFIHPFQARQLKASTSTGQWLDIQKAAMQGGQITDNPIFTGALGMYDGVVLHVDSRVPWGDYAATNVARQDTHLGKANIARAVFCGAQAGMLAFGRDSGWPFRMKWTEELRDYENQLGISAGMIWGMKKTIFRNDTTNGLPADPQDFGVITISSYSPAVS